MRVTLVALGVATVLMGCAAYAPKSGMFGYSDAQLGPNVFRVSYVGRGSVSIEDAKLIALLRAAQVTKDHGDEYFTIEGASAKENISSSTGASYYVPYSQKNPNAGGFSYGAASDISLPSVSIQIRTYLEKPDVSKDIYQADFLCQSLAPRFNTSCE